MPNRISAENPIQARYASGDLHAWLEMAVTAVRAGGEFLASTGPARYGILCEEGKDIKLQEDRVSEDLIANVLQSRAAFAMLSEECGLLQGGDGGHGLRWIVDPLDGSANYRKGIPFCCVSVGLWDRNEPLLGAIFDFNRNEVFTGIVGAGAWLNGAPMRVSDTAQVGQAVLCTGFPVAMDYSAASLSRFVRLVQQYKKIRLLGSAALSLAYVAAGRVEAYFEQKIRPWDVAAGVAVVRAAGGMVTMAGAGSESSPLTVYASNAHLPSVALD